jgi:hypothetical protein
MEISNIQMFELFKNKFGDREAEAFVYIIEEKMDTKINQRSQLLATKDDIAALKDDISALRIATKDDISALRIATREDISVLRLETKDDMRKLKDELLRTIYLTSLGQLFAIVASVISLMLLIVKK